MPDLQAISTVVSRQGIYSVIWEWILTLFMQLNGASEVTTNQPLKDNLQDVICARYIKEAEERDLERIKEMHYPLERYEALKALREDALRKCGVKP